MKQPAIDEKRYARLLSKTRPRMIHDEADLDRFTEELLRLDRIEHPSLEEQELAALLTTLIEQYEEQQYPLRPATPAETIRFLLDQRGLTDKALWSIIGSKSHTSEVLHGRRQVGVRMAAKLGKFFEVEPALFITWQAMTASSGSTL